jgi:RimJ/RimL family protein N-acetyltransferase
MAPVDHWPLFDLRVRTPRLELRFPDDQLAAEVAELAVLGIHDPGFRPFLRMWDEVPPPHQQRNTLQNFWRNRATWTPDSWVCGLAVVVDGHAAGVQGMDADAFPARRAVQTGSWLGRAYQGRGVGTEMRAAVLHLAFAGLGAVRAESGAWHDNAASLAVSRKLGYEPNGDHWALRGEEPDREIRLLLTRERWEQHRRDDIDIVGLEPCLPFFGAVEADWLVP